MTRPSVIKGKRMSPKANKGIEELRLEHDGESYEMPDLHNHRRKTHCINGHEFNLKNTYRWKNTRKCRKCKLDRQRKLKKDRK